MAIETGTKTTKTTKTLFGGSHLHHMTSPDDIAKLLDHFKQVTGRLLPEKLELNTKLAAHNFQLVSQDKYYLLAMPEVRYDTEYVMFFTLFDGKNYCFLIGKHVGPGFDTPKCLILDTDCDEVCYDNTVIDVSRVFVTKGRFLLLMKDISYFRGSRIKTRNFLEKIKIMGDFMRDSYVEDLQKQPFRLQIMRPYVDMKEFRDRLYKYPYKIESIIFLPHSQGKDTLEYKFDPR